jgi:large subunit ribosomal protein L24
MKIKKGDKVKVIKGKDRGREGTVERALPKERKVVVSGLNIYKKAVRPRQQSQKGGIVEITKPLPVENVMLICPHCGKPTRVGYKVEKGEKSRFCKKCQRILN